MSNRKIFKMKAEKVVEIIKFLQSHEIGVTVDGGWGVDALLGEQTRPHDDLDVAVPHKDVPKLRKILAEKGFSEVFRDDSREYNFVLQDHDGNQIDVHSYTFDENGRNIYGIAYLPEHLSGKGVINGCSVKCIPPEWSVKFHTGYELDANDFHDVKAICEKFNLKLPSQYEKFIK